MSKTETMLSVGNTVGKAFDSMTDEEKKEGMSNLIQKIEDNKGAERLRGKRAALTPDEQATLYKSGEVASVKGSTKFVMNSVGNPLHIKQNISNIKEEGIKNVFQYNILKETAPVCRFLVQLGILEKPESLSDRRLQKDITKDARHFKRNLGLFGKVCGVVPQLRPAKPFIDMAKPYAERYKDHGTEVLEYRLKHKEQLAAYNKDREDRLQEIQEAKKEAELEKPTKLEALKAKLFSQDNTNGDKKDPDYALAA